MVENAGFKIITVASLPTAVVKVTTTMDKIPDAERASRKKLAERLPSLDTGEHGKSFTLWHTPSQGQFYMEPGIVVARAFAPSGDVVPSELPAGRAVHYLLIGPYDELPGAWGRFFEWCAKENLALTGVNWQVYDSYDADSSKIETSLYALLA